MTFSPMPWILCGFHIMIAHRFLAKVSQENYWFPILTIAAICIVFLAIQVWMTEKKPENRIEALVYLVFSAALFVNYYFDASFTSQFRTVSSTFYGASSLGIATLGIAASIKGLSGDETS